MCWAQHQAYGYGIAMGNDIAIELDQSFSFFLPKDRVGQEIRVSMDRFAAVKDMIEALGVPHTEVGFMSFNGKEVDFFFVPRSPGLLTVRSIQTPFDVKSPSFLRPVPLSDVRFVADANVIRLGKLMLLLGFDVALFRRGNDSDIADMAQNQNRIVLTRDTALLKRKKIIFARRVRADLPYDQLSEIISFFGLGQNIDIFTRCTSCNKKLLPKAKDEIFHLLEPKTRLYFHTFFQCPECKNIYWKGSHHENMKHRFSFMGISIKD